MPLMANVEKIQPTSTTLSSSAAARPRPVPRGAAGRVDAAEAACYLIDLGDVYMTFFLPTMQAGRLVVGAEARIVLDAAPQYVIPARVSFVASEAQFTPKTVETASEREKLMFRVKAQVDPEVLRRHADHVKTGLPGVAYVRLDAREPLPDRLQRRCRNERAVSGGAAPPPEPPPSRGSPTVACATAAPWPWRASA